MNRFCFSVILALALLSACSIHSVAQRKVTRKPLAPTTSTPTAPESPEPTGEPIGKRIIFVDGTTFDVDDSWKQADTVWYRLHGLSRSVDREVKKVENRYKAPAPKPAVAPTSIDTKNNPPIAAPTPIVWIYLKDGARMRVDEVREVAEGAWYNRRNVAIFIDRERIARIERELPGAGRDEWNPHGWSSGNPTIDQLIKANSTRFAIDPYLVFLVIEQESHFRTRAVSPKGAQGLMQLMPGTARRFGVKRPFDAAENIRGGTQYLKELLTMFNNRVDLALASYNAGEGRVLNYGNQVPPFRETREYVRKISAQYRKQKAVDKTAAKAPASERRY